MLYSDSLPYSSAEFSLMQIIIDSCWKCCILYHTLLEMVYFDSLPSDLSPATGLSPRVVFISEGREVTIEKQMK